MLRLPINHYEGNYTCDPETLAGLEANGQVVLRYLDNPNGSLADIAGVANRSGNVVGLMPHPERASHELLGSEDGLVTARVPSSLRGERKFAAGPGTRRRSAWR